MCSPLCQLTITNKGAEGREPGRKGSCGLGKEVDSAGSSRELTVFSMTAHLVLGDCELSGQRMWWRTEDAQRHNKNVNESIHFMLPC